MITEQFPNYNPDAPESFCPLIKANCIIGDCIFSYCGSNSGCLLADAAEGIYSFSTATSKTPDGFYMLKEYLKHHHQND